MNRLKELRNAKKVTQGDVAKEIGVTQSNYAKYEREEVIPKQETWEKLADYFKVNILYLMGLSKFKSGTGIPEILGQLVKKKRKEGGISSQKLAKMIDVPHQDILKYENGEMVIPPAILDKIAASLKTSSVSLYYDLGYLSSSLNNNRDILTEIEQHEVYETEEYKKRREEAERDVRNHPLKEEDLFDRLNELDESSLRILLELAKTLQKEQEKNK